jgi:hypothetical protein
MHETAKNYYKQKVKEGQQVNQVEHCLMESTGIYWMSLYTILTDCGISVIVANPTHIKQIPKRKTDRKDARWLCMLLMHGLVRASFMPTSEQRVLRDHAEADCFIPVSRTRYKTDYGRYWKLYLGTSRQIWKNLRPNASRISEKGNSFFTAPNTMLIFQRSINIEIRYHQISTHIMTENLSKS